MESIIIGNYPRSGARYLTALMCSRFNQLLAFNAAQVSLGNIEDSQKTNTILKTQDSDYSGKLPYKTIYTYRDPRDVMATFAQDDKMPLLDLATNTVINWISNAYDWMSLSDDGNSILFLPYESIIESEEEVVEQISNFLDLPSNLSNNTRDSELVAGKRQIGLYKDVLHETHIKLIMETTEDCLEDLKEYL